MDLLLELDLACKRNGELVMNDRHMQISLVTLRTNRDGLPENLVENGLEGTAHSDLAYGQIKFVFDRRMLVEARCVYDSFAEEDRRTLELWNYFMPFAGLRPLALYHEP